MDTTPAPTVLPPSRMAKRRPGAMAMGWIRLTFSVALSPAAAAVSTREGGGKERRNDDSRVISHRGQTDIEDIL